MKVPIADKVSSFENAGADFRFATAVAAFGMVLRESPHKGASDLNMVLRLAESALGTDPRGHRQEFINVVRTARALREVAAF